jgi:hypothetical protein
MFRTPLQARRFFEDKISQQTELEGAPLSPDERLMLTWSESEPDSIADPELVDRLAAEISDEDYQAKIAGLLARSYTADVARDSTARTTWTDAYRVMNQADYYMGILVDRAVGQRTVETRSHRLLDRIGLVMTALVVGGAAFYAGRYGEVGTALVIGLVVLAFTGWKWLQRRQVDRTP